MRRLLVGLGHPWRGDDGVGPVVVERVFQQGLPHGVTSVVAFQLLPEDAEVWAGVDHVILVDAAVDLAPGRVSVREFDALDSAETSSHHFGPEAVVELAGRLYGRRPRVTLVAVGVQAFDAIDALSPEVAAAVDEAEACVRRLLSG